MRLIHFDLYHINPDRVIYLQRLSNVTRIFMEGGFTIDVPDSDRSVAYRLTKEGAWDKNLN